jgi:hypothetical protein
MCDQWKSNDSINPLTNKKIQKNKGVYNQLVKICDDEEKSYNLFTNGINPFTNKKFKNENIKNALGLFFQNYSSKNTPINEVKLNYDVYFEILKNIDLGDLKNYCNQSKMFKQMCQDNQTSISKLFLNKYKVEYMDPNNFIYKYNNKNINDYKIENTWNYKKILKLYMLNYNKFHIKCSYKNITSFPIYPNMTEFEGDNNQLTSFPIQPNMIYFSGENNQLTSFPIQPKMTHFDGDYNQLTSFPIQPKMVDFYGHNNKLTSFPIQPKMTHFYGHNNKLTSFPIQPNMKEFYGSNNQLTSFPIQPNMIYFYGRNNQLTSFPIQPKMIYFYGDYNQLTSFSIQPKMTRFDGRNNQLTSFPIQPKMKRFNGVRYQLTSAGSRF